MTKKEREDWLAEINRIKNEENNKKEDEMKKQIEKILTQKAEFNSNNLTQENIGW